MEVGGVGESCPQDTASSSEYSTGPQAEDRAWSVAPAVDVERDGGEVGGVAGKRAEPGLRALFASPVEDPGDV